MDGITNTLIIFALIGAFASIFRRYLVNIRKKSRESRFWNIILNDYEFNKLATLPLLFFLYTVFQGAGFGLAVGILFEGYCVKSYLLPEYGMVCIVNNGSILQALVAVIAVIGVRILIETYVIIFKIGQLFINQLSRNSDDSQQ